MVNNVHVHLCIHTVIFSSEYPLMLTCRFGGGGGGGWEGGEALSFGSPAFACSAAAGFWVLSSLQHVLLHCALCKQMKYNSFVKLCHNHGGICYQTDLR